MISNSQKIWTHTFWNKIVFTVTCMYQQITLSTDQQYQVQAMSGLPLSLLSVKMSSFTVHTSQGIHSGGKGHRPRFFWQNSKEIYKTIKWILWYIKVSKHIIEPTKPFKHNKIYIKCKNCNRKRNKAFNSCLGTDAILCCVNINYITFCSTIYLVCYHTEGKRSGSVVLISTLYK